jgi:hypothetical protein
MPDRPYYCYKDTAWHLTGTVEPDTHITTDNADISLIIDRNNQPHICYQFETNDSSGIKYAKGDIVEIDEKNNDINNNTVSSVLEVFPNPFTNKIRIKINDVEYKFKPSFCSLTIYNSIGEVIRNIPNIQTTDNTVWMRNDEKGFLLPAGIYFIKLKYANEEYFKKIINIKKK